MVKSSQRKSQRKWLGPKPVAKTLPPAADTFRTLKELRHGCAKLDIRFSHSIKFKGKWRSIPFETLIEMYRDRREHMEGAKALATWAGNQTLSPVLLFQRSSPPVTLNTPQTPQRPSAPLSTPQHP